MSPINHNFDFGSDISVKQCHCGKINGIITVHFMQVHGVRKHSYEPITAQCLTSLDHTQT